MLFSTYAQEYSSAPAVLAISIDNEEPILSIRGIRNYNIYSMTVDTVLFINVRDDFKGVFSEQYLLNCKLLLVCLDSLQYYQPKTDWNVKNRYIIEVGVGFGISDLEYYGIINTNVQLSPDPFNIKIGSWGLLPESIKGMFLTPLKNDY